MKPKKSRAEIHKEYREWKRQANSVDFLGKERECKRAAYSPTLQKLLP